MDKNSGVLKGEWILALIGNCIQEINICLLLAKKLQKHDANRNLLMFSRAQSQIFTGYCLLELFHQIQWRISHIFPMGSPKCGFIFYFIFLT